MIRAKCPICEESIELGIKVKFLERAICPSCEALLEVVNTNPIELDWIYYDEHFDSNDRERVKKASNGRCPLCKDMVQIGSSQMKVGSKVLCSGCDAELEIVSLIPLELEWPYDGGFGYYFGDEDTFEDHLDEYLN